MTVFCGGIFSSEHLSIFVPYTCTVFCGGIYSSVHLSFLFLTPSPYLVQVFITVSICRFPLHLYRILCRYLQQ